MGDLRQLFDALDLNHNGSLTRGEVITALRLEARRQKAQGKEVSYGAFKDLEDAANFFNQADADQNKQVNFEEFKKAFEQQKQ